MWTKFDLMELFFRIDTDEIQENMWDEVFPLLDQHFFQVNNVKIFKALLKIIE